MVNRKSKSANFLNSGVKAKWENLRGDKKPKKSKKRRRIKGPMITWDMFVKKDVLDNLDLNNEKLTSNSTTNPPL